MKRPILAALVVLGLTSGGLAQPAPRRDSTALPSEAGTAIVRGRVTALATEQPLHRVRLTLSGATLANPLSAVTDTTGRFELAGVPAGSYSLTAARAGYLTIEFGQRRPREAGRTIDVQDREVVEDIDLALPRASALSGRIVDELGEPAAGVRVEAMDNRYVRGRREPVQAGIAITNDIGQFRITGLDPGNYYLRAASTETWESDDGRENFAYAHTFYPGVPALDQTRPLTVQVGQQLDGLDFHLVPTRAARITGALLSATGEPIAGQRVNLDRITRGLGGGLFSASFGGTATSRKDGTFDIRNLAPGEYMVYSGSRETEDVRQQVFVAGVDVSGILLVPRSLTALSGIVVTDDGKPADFAAPRLRLTPVAVNEGLQVWGSPSPQPLGPDWTFRFVSLQGRFLFRLSGLPDSWMLRDVYLGDRTVTDTPIEIAPGSGEIKGLRAVITRSAGHLAGRVVDLEGKAHGDGTVIVFAADPSRWTIASRFVAAVRPARDGRFSLRLPAGAYLATARDFVVEGSWEDPEYLRSIAGEAVKLELREGASETITLTVEQPR
jgi:hypothetical protein